LDTHLVAGEGVLIRQFPGPCRCQEWYRDDLPTVTHKAFARLDTLDALPRPLGVHGSIETLYKGFSQPGFIGQFEPKSKFPLLSGNQILVQKGCVGILALLGLFQVVSPFQCPFFEP
jgi:hypothetical protein